MKIEYHTTTNAGGRPVNEDHLAVATRGNCYCFVLCDGLGGHGKGDVAAKLVTSIVSEYFETCSNMETFFDEVLTVAQNALLKLQKEQKAPHKMKTTVVLLVIEPNRCTVMHVGDSRLYRFRDGMLATRTIDHSVPQMLVSIGEIEEKDIRNHPDRNRLLTAMGDERNGFKYDKSVYDLQENDAFLLCSDGFWELITEFDMTSSLRINPKVKGWLGDMKKIVESNGNGREMDNYTAIAVMVKG